MTWRIARSLDKLLAQINAAAPNRDKSSDGGIGNAEHASRSSDHNPWVMDGSVGVVTARDYTHDPAHGCDSYALAESLRTGRDPRVKYIISNRRISNPAISDGAWRPYTGTNPHDHHCHVSVSQSKALYDDVTPWAFSLKGDGPLIHPVKPRRPTIKRGTSGADVKYLQRMLGLPDTGEFDSRTEQAVIDFQRKYGLVPDGVVGIYTWTVLEK